MAQMVFIMLTQGNLIQVGDLNDIDTVALIIAAACHDFGHDGFNNAYHVNANTNRSIRYRDESVQENYHAAESFQLLMHSPNNFICKLSKEDLKTFKKRMMGTILATDMAKHAEDFANFKRTLELKGISK